MQSAFDIYGEIPYSADLQITGVLFNGCHLV